MDRIEKYFGMPDGPEKDAFFKQMSSEEKRQIYGKQSASEAQQGFNPIQAMADRKLQEQQRRNASLVTDPGMIGRHQAAMKMMPPSTNPAIPVKSPEQQKLEDESYMQLLGSMGNPEDQQAADAMKNKQAEEDRKQQLRDRFQNVLTQKPKY